MIIRISPHSLSLFFSSLLEGKKRLHAVSRHEMPTKDRWRGHTKAFGISRELSTAVASYDEKGAKPQGIFGLLDTSEIPGHDDGNHKEPSLNGDKSAKKKKHKKHKKKKKAPRVKQVTKINIAGF